MNGLETTGQELIQLEKVVNKWIPLEITGNANIVVKARHRKTGRYIAFLYAIPPARRYPSVKFQIHIDPRILDKLPRIGGTDRWKSVAPADCSNIKEVYGLLGEPEDCRREGPYAVAYSPADIYSFSGIRAKAMFKWHNGTLLLKLNHNENTKPQYKLEIKHDIFTAKRNFIWVPHFIAEYLRTKSTLTITYSSTSGRHMTIFVFYLYKYK